MNLDRILTSSPVNQTAARVVSRKRGSVETTGDLTREELTSILDRLQRKLRLLKVVLRIDTKAKHANLTYKARRGMRTYRGAANPRSVNEYLRVGQEIQRMSRALSEIRAKKSGTRTEQHGWSA